MTTITNKLVTQDLVWILFLARRILSLFMNRFVKQMNIGETSTSAKLESLANGIWPKYETAHC